MKHCTNTKPGNGADTLPQMSDSGVEPTYPVSALDQYGEKRALQVAGERPLTIKVDGQEIVTLMTLGTHPEKLALGYLRNQHLIEKLGEVTSIEVDWCRELAQVTTVDGKGIADLDRKTARRMVTTGCGQGTVFSCTLDKLYDNRLPRVTVRQSDVYTLIGSITQHNRVYREAGSVHGCALCRKGEVLLFVEDVGRHNATDTIAGEMWLEGIEGGDKMFYTTVRLTSEIVMKAAHMGIPVLVSRNGITHMGLELARDLGVVLIARAKSRHFLVYNGEESVVFDAPPKKPNLLRYRNP